MRTWSIITPRPRSPSIPCEEKGGAFINSVGKASLAAASGICGGQQQLREDYALLLRAIKTPDQGQLLHARIKKDGLQDDPFLKGLLIQMYGKCGSLHSARLLFDGMPERPMLAWKSIIRAYVQDGHCSDALQLFQQLLQEGFVSDKYTFVSILTACANTANLACGRQVHALVASNGFSSDIAVGTALVNMYGKCDTLTFAIEIFEGMDARHVIVWNVLIAAHSKHNQADRALFLFHQMQEEGALPNRITFINVLSACIATFSARLVGEKVYAIFWTHEFRADIAMGNALLHMYCKSGWLQDASIVFDGLSTQNSVSWTSMIEAYTQQGQDKKAFQSFEQIKQQGALPDQVTYIGILETCAISRGLFEGKKMHAQLIGIGIHSNAVVGTALVHMYGNCGAVERASGVFDSMSCCNILTWTSMIALTSQYGEEKGTFQSFLQMMQEGFMPDKVVFFSLLDICYRQRNVLQGKLVHAFLIGAGYELDHNAGAALINLYLNCKSMEEATILFCSASDLGVGSWTAMIAACTEHGQDVRALQLFCQMQQEGIIPEDLAFVHLLRACANWTSLLNGRRIHTCITHRSLDANGASIEASLINMYGKCGGLREAQAVFDGDLKHNLISWTALLAAYVHHGVSTRALQILKFLSGRGFRLDDTALLQALLACSRSGLIDEAHDFFFGLVQDHPIRLGLDHFCCMVDALGRVGILDYAEAFMHAMPCQPSAALWMAQLGSCRQQVDVERAECAAKYVTEINESQGGLYVVLSNVYAVAGRWDDQLETVSPLVLSA